MQARLIFYYLSHIYNSETKRRFRIQQMNPPDHT